MKTTFIETYVDGIQKLGSDFTSVCHNLNTTKRLDNAIKKHIDRMNLLKIVHPELKGNYQIKYNSIYK